jgi:hypothetical protein
MVCCRDTVLAYYLYVLPSATLQLFYEKGCPVTIISAFVPIHQEGILDFVLKYKIAKFVEASQSFREIEKS